MSIKPIIHAPNKILSGVSREVTEINNPEILRLIEDMKDTVVASNGIGLAAPQIGVPLRVIVINFDIAPYAIINPEIKWSSAGTSALEEGCLSVPNFFTKIYRPKTVLVSGTDEKGAPFEIKAKDMLAKIFQHEIDHINGILISDHNADKFLL